MVLNFNYAAKFSGSGGFLAPLKFSIFGQEFTDKRKIFRQPKIWGSNCPSLPYHDVTVCIGTGKSN